MIVQYLTRTRLVGRALPVAIAALAAAVAVVQTSVPAFGQPIPVPLGRGTFIDDVAVQIRVNPEGQPVHVMNVRNASDVVVLQITIRPGVVAPWHAHWAPAILVNAGPGTLTTMSSHDFIPRQLPPGSAVIDRGFDHLHMAWNESDADVVLYGTFLGVPPGESPVLPAAPP